MSSWGSFPGFVFVYWFVMNKFFSGCPPGCGMACALAACSVAIRDVNVMHLASCAERSLCSMALQSELALPTLTSLMPSMLSSAATTQMSVADLVISFDGLWALVLKLLKVKRWNTAPRGSRKRCLHCYLAWLDLLGTNSWKCIVVSFVSS